MKKEATSGESIPVDRIQFWLLPVADGFMVLMLSRPRNGSLRTTRVTLATIWLSVVVSVAAGIPALLVTGAAPPNPWYAAAAFVFGAIGMGSAVLATFGIRQRLLIAAAEKAVPAQRRAV